MSSFRGCRCIQDISGELVNVLQVDSGRQWGVGECAAGVFRTPVGSR